MTEQAAQGQFVSNVVNLVQTALNSNNTGQFSSDSVIITTSSGTTAPLNISGDYPNGITIVDTPVQPFGASPQPFGTFTWPPMGQLTEADVKRIVQEVLDASIKEKPEDQKGPNDLMMLMKQYGFPQLMIDIVMKTLAEKWPVKIEPKERMSDLIHEEETHE